MILCQTKQKTFSKISTIPVWFSPKAYCPKCSMLVESSQFWKLHQKIILNGSDETYGI